MADVHALHYRVVARRISGLHGTQASSFLDAKVGEMGFRRSIVWLRRDLRLDDNTAMYEACRQSDSVALAFVLDPQLLTGPTVGAPIVQSFFSALGALRESLRALGSDLVLLEGDFAAELQRCAKDLSADAIFYNKDTDPRAIARDTAVCDALRAADIRTFGYDDLNYFPADAIKQPGGKTYSVFTPYRRRWFALREETLQKPVASHDALKKRLVPIADLPKTQDVPEPEKYGHTASRKFPLSSERTAQRLLSAFLESPVDAYGDQRNIPAVAGTSRLSPQLRAGTIGIRRCVEDAFAARKAAHGSTAKNNIDVWISELVWRDFYHQILVHHPHVVERPFDPRGENVKFLDDDAAWTAWEQGTTGYPLIDAAMRQLHTYGWMHNRLRMITASFLTKDLLIDYRRGERHFEQWLADADLAANNGGWQWSSSTGTDAAPYFRVFNPITQSISYDPDGTFIRQMIPELRELRGKAIHAPWTATPFELREAGIEIGKTYPAPIVDHAAARLRCLEAFGAVFGKGQARE